MIKESARSYCQQTAGLSKRKTFLWEQ